MSVRKDTLSINLTNPISYLAQVAGVITKEITEIFSLSFNPTRASRIQINKGLGNIKNIRLPKFNKRNMLKIILPIFLILLVVFLIRQASTAQPLVGGQTSIDSSDTNPLATMNINREFKFPLRDQKGKEVGQLTYNITSAELRKQIIVKGKRATAVDGRIFLIINLKIVNTLDQGLEVNSRDYIRISVNKNTKELFAPDIHNDPVEVQAISTKNTRVGLAINETDRNIELRIGEINGKKEIIPVSFK